MNKMIILIFVCLPGLAFALNNFKPQTEWISFYGSAPPAFFYVTNNAGQKAGADPALAFTPLGQQGDGLHGVEEITNSVADQENFRNDMTGQPSKHTHWSVRIPDGGNQTYTVNIIGLNAGEGTLEIRTDIVKRPKMSRIIDEKFLVDKGSTKKYVVSYNSANSSLSVIAMVSNKDLLNDVKTACQLNEITSEHACKRLEEKAEAIQDALDKHHYEKAEELIWSFLHMLGDSRPEGCGDDDDHQAVKEPALTILKEDAKALLKQIEKGNHGKQGQKEDKGK